MANFNSYSRTNYFKVTDSEVLKELVEKVNAELFEGDNNTFAFGDYEDIITYYDEDKDSYVEIFDELQSILPDGEAVIIKLIGYENLRYLVGVAYVVTNNDIQTVVLDDFALDLAAKMLGVEQFSTRMDY